MNVFRISSRGQAAIQGAKKFATWTVKQWNSAIEEPTLSVYLGLIGIDESASKECGAITLELLLRAGVLVEGSDGRWHLADDWETRRIYLIGDVKTIENVTKFVRDMQERRIAYSEANIQSDVFLQALTVVQQTPGD